MTVSTFTDEVGLVSHRLDVACENQLKCLRQKPRNVIQIVDVMLYELRENWKLFYLETVKTVDKTLQMKQKCELVSVSSSSTVESKEATDSILKYDLPENGDNRMIGSVRQSNNYGLRLSLEEDSSYEHTCKSVTNIGSFVGSNHSTSDTVELSCENIQLYSRLKPTNTVYITSAMIRDLREKWDLLCLETSKMQVFDGTLVDKPSGTHTRSSILTSGQELEPVHTVSSQKFAETDLSEDCKEVGKPKTVMDSYGMDNTQAAVSEAIAAGVNTLPYDDQTVDQQFDVEVTGLDRVDITRPTDEKGVDIRSGVDEVHVLSLIHISEPTRPY